LRDGELPEAMEAFEDMKAEGEVVWVRARVEVRDRLRG